MGPDQARVLTDRVIDNVEKVVVGKRDAIELALLAAMCGGHVLIDDVPGVGKTVLAKSLSISLGCSFKRIQFTPDLLPSDVLGVSVYNQHTGDFDFRPGPIMAQVLLADEVNRGTPKTQSALLEAMEESQITVDGATHILPHPFLVLATQNPLEHEGTFPLPEAQRDRFFLRIHIGYPGIAEEIEVMDRQQVAHPINSLEAVTGADDLTALQASVRDVFVDDLIKQYIVEIVNATRDHPAIFVGGSPRGSIALYRGIQARALLQGRDYALPDDVKALAHPILQHRLILSATARVTETTADSILDEVIGSIPVPGTSAREWFRG